MEAENESFETLAPRRPAIHLAPPAGWMGDPNGLVCLDGTFHVCYQHNPHDSVWGPMHWRHATSTDLLSWTDHGIALEPDELGTIFSGSAVLDHHNTSGLGRDGRAPLIAVFTHNSYSGQQQQSLAYSLNDGSTWTKYESNPVIESDAQDFRDPKVFWHNGPDHGHWVMSVAAGDRIEFYRSANLWSWDKTGEFNTDLPGSTGFWECPDLIQFVEPAKGWSLIVSVTDAGPHGHSGVIAFDGEFDGETFRATSRFQNIDHGPDFYAAQSFSNLSSDPMWIGWMNSWRYANSHPSQGHRGIHSIPRTLTRASDGDLLQTPTLPTSPRQLTPESSARADQMSAFDITASGEASIVVTGEHGRAATIELGSDAVRLDRTMPAHHAVPNTFAMSRASSDNVRIIIDHGSIEIFADNGRSVMTALIFPGADWTLSVDGLAAVTQVTRPPDQRDSTNDSCS